MSKAIKKMYRSAGVAAPRGRGIHTKAAHSCVIGYQKKGMKKGEAWKRCMGALKTKAVKKSHRRKE